MRRFGGNHLNTAGTPSSSWLQVPLFALGPEIDVVGESHYQQALLAASGGRSANGPRRPLVTVELVCEPDNRFDPNAVAARLDGRTVGYLPREMAATCSTLLADSAGETPTCRGLIVGGWERGEDLGWFGLKLLLHPAWERWSDGCPFLPSSQAMPAPVTVMPEKRQAVQALLGRRRKTTRRVVGRLDDAGHGALGVMIDGDWIGHVLSAGSLLHLVNMVKAAGCPTTAVIEIRPDAEPLVRAYDPDTETP